MEGCKNLEKLYLYSNQIEKIPDILSCERLTVLNLAGNCINRLRVGGHPNSIFRLFFLSSIIILYFIKLVSGVPSNYYRIFEAWCFWKNSIWLITTSKDSWMCFHEVEICEVSTLPEILFLL